MSDKRIRVRPRKRSSAVHPTEVQWEKALYALFARVVQDVGWDGDVPSVLGALRARDWEAVLARTKAGPPQQYADWQKYYAACQVEHLFKKLPIPGMDLSLREAAFGTLLADEHRNRRTNQKFRILGNRMWNSGEVRFEHKNALYERLMRRMQRIIASILGASPDFSAIAAKCDFGPGSCVGAGGDNTHPYAKFDRITCSEAAMAPFSSAVWEHHQFRALFLQQKREIVCVDPDYFREEISRWVTRADYNKIDFVPKNVRTHRTTASEPIGNAWVQRGIGEEIADLLRKARPWINHRDQTRNQRLAKRASLLDNPVPLATIDLKSSSQSFATEMVRTAFALAPGWFDIMNRTRSAHWRCKLDPGGNETLHGTYELFVSMGNGFCFPLQMVIYSAAIEACYAEFGRRARTYGVFGDDLIVEQRVALLLIEWLKFLGVRTNTDKTFVFGPFRESCGADFWDGVNVRPYVLDQLPNTDRQLVKVANGINYRTPFPLWGAWWALWYLMPQTARSTVRPFQGPDDSGLTVPVSFYDVRRLDEYDHGLQRYRLRQFSSRSMPDDDFYVSKRSQHAQMFLALRGSTPAMQHRIEEGREAPVHIREGIPTPSFRRKTRLLLETL